MTASPNFWPSKRSKASAAPLIHFRLLRLSGFKSFVDSTEMAIEPGLTGIVGPNGCGKSNLVEGLRWVMGESSARQMRGDEMDDVIFGGTASRPSRNLAEVSLLLDNGDRRAPSQFNDSDEVEVVRRIDRGRGSLYRVNGKEVRARDVQILFADAATGARSTAIVSQGRVSALISAKPADRRSLLEEAAGIGGLHSRRHEAELRLAAAETNLSRLEDLLAVLDGQLQGLRKQSRQTGKYRSLSEQIRRIEARQLAAAWQDAVTTLEAAHDSIAEIERQVEQLTGRAAEAAVRQNETAASLPSLRDGEAQAAGELQRLRLAREQLEGDEARLTDARRDMAQRLEQITADAAREAAHAEDALAALERLRAEADGLTAGGEAEAAQLADRQACVERQLRGTNAAEAELSLVMEEVAAFEAERGAARRALAEAEGRRDRLQARQAELRILQERAALDQVEPSALAAAEMNLDAALAFLADCRMALEVAEQRRVAAHLARESARQTLQLRTAAQSRLLAEADALRQLMAETGGVAKQPVLDQVTTTSGYELALGAALGEDLSASLTPDAAFHWETLAPLGDPPTLPDGSVPLSDFVAAPAALGRRLTQIGVIDDPAEGDRLRLSLRPGQRLVAANGAMWRWDGFTVKAGAPNAAALRLRQRNRLRELLAQIEDSQLVHRQAERDSAQADDAVEREAVAELQLRAQGRAAENELGKVRERQAQLAQRAATATARVMALADQAQALLADHDEAVAALEAARERAAQFPSDDGRRERLNRMRADLAEQRLQLVEAQSALDRHQRETGERRRRLAVIGTELASWQQRHDSAFSHRRDIEERRAAATASLQQLDAQPHEIAARRQQLLDQLAVAEAGRRQAAALLADGEQAQTAADRLRREAEQSLAQAREERVRRLSALSVAEAAGRALADRIRERLAIAPTQLDQGRVEAAEAVTLQSQFDRLSRERDMLGPINLRADEEVAELDGRIAILKGEQADLVAAIQKLRQAIAEINREGRQRLLASFEEVDQHFRTLFVRLFGGGRAQLTLTESPDPLQAGLEILASPPGKRLQILSLLSGGEQALTALALLFAVFMTNPAPICVLDEVDAPLDDANVDRFCSMVAEIAHASKTRFLVVTHHRMTMARVDRLYGVTMAERGVSSLVSVDLRTAETLREDEPKLAP